MLAVAVVAVMAWSTRLDGPYVLAWEVPMLAAACAMWAASGPWRPAAGIFGGTAAGAALAAWVGIGGTSAASVLETSVGIGGAVVGGMAGLFTVWLAVVGSRMLRTYELVEEPGADGLDPHEPGHPPRHRVQGIELP